MWTVPAPPPPGHRPLDPGKEGRAEVGEKAPARLGLSPGSGARGHLPRSRDVDRSQSGGSRLPSVRGCPLGGRRGSRLPLQSGKWSRPTAAAGTKGKEAAERRPPFPSNLTLTPRRLSNSAGGARSGRLAARRPRPCRESERPRAVGGETPARTPRPEAGSPKHEPAARCKPGRGTCSRQRARGAGARTRNAHPLGPRECTPAPRRLTHAVFLVLRRYPHGWTGLRGARAASSPRPRSGSGSGSQCTAAEEYAAGAGARCRLPSPALTPRGPGCAACRYAGGGRSQSDALAATRRRSHCSDSLN